jgi:hypothetical protein
MLAGSHAISFFIAASSSVADASHCRAQRAICRAK